MTISQSAWAAFTSIEDLAHYSPSEIEAFADRLFGIDDEETILQDFCAINRYANVIETIIKHIRPTITQIVMNQSKGFEIEGYKFTYRPQTKYDYSFCPMWRNANESVKLNQEYQKQIEEVCKKGGSLGGVEIKKVPVEVVDNFTMTKIIGRVGKDLI